MILTHDCFHSSMLRFHLSKLRFHSSNSHFFFKIQTFHNKRKIASLTKGSIALLRDKVICWSVYKHGYSCKETKKRA